MPSPGTATSTAIRALTVKQPWACAIATGAKDTENRRWRTRYRGLLAIHAGATGDRQPTAQWALAATAYATAPTGLRQRSAILAIARLSDCHPQHSGCCTSPWGEVGPGIWHWVLTDVRALPAPITPVRGALGLWRPAEQLAAAIRAHTEAPN